MAGPLCGRFHGYGPSLPHGAPRLDPHPILLPSLQVVPLVDQVLERQDLNKDGLVNPPELLLLHSRGQGPLGQPHVQRPGESLAEAGAVLGGDAGVSSPGHGPAEEQIVPPAAAPNAEAMEAEEASEIEAPEGEAAPVLGEPGEG